MLAHCTLCSSVRASHVPSDRLVPTWTARPSSCCKTFENDGRSGSCAVCRTLVGQACTQVCGLASHVVTVAPQPYLAIQSHLNGYAPDIELKSELCPCKPVDAQMLHKLLCALVLASLPLRVRSMYQR